MSRRPFESTDVNTQEGLGGLGKILDLLRMHSAGKHMCLSLIARHRIDADLPRPN